MAVKLGKQNKTKRNLTQILRIRWPETISNEEVHRRAETTNASEDIIMQKRWRWIDHVIRMDTNRFCTTALPWQPRRTRKVGRPKTICRRMVETDRDELGMNS
jgi:hypothetical protein